MATPAITIPSAPGGSRSFTPGERQRRGEGDAQRAVGELDGEATSDQHARDGADQEPAGRGEVDVSRQELPGAGYSQQHGRVEDVRADDLGGRERERDQHHEAEQRAAAHRREADDEPANDAGRHGDRAVAVSQDERLVLGTRVQVGLDEERDPADDECDAENRLRRVLVARHRSAA